jgi:hypothetical protein
MELEIQVELFSSWYKSERASERAFDSTSIRWNLACEARSDPAPTPHDMT